MTTLRVELGSTTTTVTDGDGRHEVPIGVRSLAGSIAGDPPDPADLSNAIGLVLDHLDDVDRALGPVGTASFEFAGPSAAIVAAVEAGGDVSLPFRLERAGAEDVFRTLATEPRAARSHNPGLPDDWVHDILGACCWIVAVMRHYGVGHARVVP